MFALSETAASFQSDRAINLNLFQTILVALLQA